MDLLVALSTFDKRIDEKHDNSELNKNILKAAHFSLQLWEDGKKKWAEVGTLADT